MAKRPLIHNLPPLCVDYGVWSAIDMYFRGIQFNPMEFSSQTRKKVGNIFSGKFLGKRVTFVFGEELVRVITNEKNEVLSFNNGYNPLLTMTFGHGLLTDETYAPQIKVLKKYLTTNYLEEYVVKSEAFVNQLYQQEMPESGVVDLTKILRTITFQAGVRNFLGQDFVELLPNYDYRNIIDVSEIGWRAIFRLLPNVFQRLQQYYDQWKAPSHFDAEILSLYERKKGVEKPENMFEELAAQFSIVNGPVRADRKLFTNLVSLFIFGSSYNNYNVICYVMREILANKELLAQLQEEQLSLKHLPLTQEKISQMKLLNEHVFRIGCDNAFPFLLRKTLVDYDLGPYTIPKGELIAYSPRITENANENLIFGAGLHACPAKRYACNSIAVVISLLLLNYTLEPVGLCKKEANERFITFPEQTAMTVCYKRRFEQL